MRMLLPCIAFVLPCPVRKQFHKVVSYLSVMPSLDLATCKPQACTDSQLCTDAQVLDDQTFAALQSVMLFNNVEILHKLQRDPAFFPDLFKKLRTTAPKVAAQSLEVV